MQVAIVTGGGALLAGLCPLLYWARLAVELAAAARCLTRRRPWLRRETLAVPTDVASEDYSRPVRGDQGPFGCWPSVPTPARRAAGPLEDPSCL